MPTPRGRLDDFASERQRAAEAKRLREKALARAVANVLDGTCNMTGAAQGAGVSHGSVSKAVAEARAKMGEK